MSIPVILIQETSNSKLRESLENNPQINLIDVLESSKWSSIQLVTPFSEQFIVINLDSVERATTVVTGLRLRNKGNQVFISCSLDFEDLVNLMIDTYQFQNMLVDQKSPIETELLVTEQALRILGDITQIIRNFEATQNSRNGQTCTDSES